MRSAQLRLSAMIPAEHSELLARQASVTFECGAADGSAPVLTEATAALRRELRESLALPAHFLAGAGHQPILWHAGILAKFIAASAIAGARAGPANWIHFLSDQDGVDAFRMDLPLRDAHGAVRRGSIRLVANDPHVARDAVAAVHPSQAAREIDLTHVASQQAVDGCLRVRTAIDQTTDAPHAGIQLARVMHICAAQWLPAPGAIVSSNALIACAGAQPIVERILSDPVANAQAFNAAVRSDPHSAKPLHIAGDSTEVPLWGVCADGRRERIGASEARRRHAQGRVLLPRAFLASGLMRVICDTFVHGTGGARYERVAEQWWRAFLGIELPSFATASATLVPEPERLGLRADLTTGNAVTWRRAWWDPTQLDRPPEQAPDSHKMLEPVRAAILARIAQAPRRSAARRDGYRALTAHIDALRFSQRARLDALKHTESAQLAAGAQRALLHDRTWPFVLLADASITAMATTIIQRINAPAS
ncbi:MAG: hypothetical protein EXS17_02560 [Phycisphaerales bacterium]|nr:hypothetical protein [Phycisphaerales bacterium]